MSIFARMLILIGLLAGGGCANSGDVRASGFGAAGARHRDEPIGVQMMRIEPLLKTQRFSNLVSFEAPSDTVFVSAAGGNVERSEAQAHTGRYALRSDARELEVKFSALVPPDAFPGTWTLLGGYVYAPQGARVTVGCHVGPALVAERTIGLPAGRWTAAMLDVSQLAELPAKIGSGAAWSVRFRIDDSSTPVWLDDILLIDNRQTLFGRGDDETASASGSFGDAWSIRRKGIYYIITAPGRFTTRLLTAEAGGGAGWTPLETNAKRARFASSGGTQKSVTIYNDGRAYWDGSYRPLSAAAAEPPYVQQHLSPAEVSVAEEFGRVDRDTAGDADNDGYNESRGAYQIRAIGPRLEIGLVPRTPTVVRPVFEIAGMPPEKVLVTLQGRLIEDLTRLEDGTLLIDVPARVNRATTIYVKVQ